MSANDGKDKDFALEEDVFARITATNAGATGCSVSSASVGVDLSVGQSQCGVTSRCKIGWLSANFGPGFAAYAAKRNLRQLSRL